MAQAQSRLVLEKVTSPDNEGMSGVNVLLKGATTGAVTKADGTYQLTIPANAKILVYSFIGCRSATYQFGAAEFVALNTVENYTPKSSLVTMNLLRPDLREVSFSYPEQLLLEAEAIARICTRRLRPGHAADAGVRESLLSFSMPAAQASTYADQLPALTAAAYRVTLAQQQYLDLFMRPIEGWPPNRRSGPVGQEISPMSTPVTDLVRRLLYRSEEISTKPNTPTGLALDLPLWFDK